MERSREPLNGEGLQPTSRAEQALRESEALRRIALAGGRMGTWRWNLKDRLIWGDAQFLALWGFPPSDDPHPLTMFTDRMTPDGAAEMETIVTRAIEAGEEFDGPLQITSGPTAGRWIQWRGRAADGDTTILHGVTFDVTSQRQSEAALRESEERQAFLLKLSDTLRPIANAEEVQRAATRLLGEHLGASRVFYVVVERDGETGTIYADYTNGVPSRTGRYRLSAFSNSALAEWRAGRIASTSDVDADPSYSAEERRAYAVVSTRAGVGVPLVKEGRLAAILGINQSTPREWTGQELKLASEVADRTWEAVERVRAEAALRESQERQRHLVEMVPAMLWWADPVGQEITLNARWLDYTGQTEAETQDFGWLAMIHPDDFQGTDKAFRHAFAIGEPLEREQRIRRADGEYRWHQVRHIPIHDEEGRITKWFGAAIDIHENKLAREAQDRSELFSRALVEGVPQLVWRAVDGGDWTWASPQWTAFTGQSEPDSHGHGWLDPVHPDDRDAAMRFWHQAEASGRLEMEGRIRHAASGKYRWFQTRAAPVRASDGAIVEWLGTSTDVDDLRRLQDRQQILVGELQHRVRNVLTIVRSVFTRTAEGDAPLEQVVDHFRGRLDNLARTQVVVTQNPEGLVDLRGLIFDELLSVGFAESPNVVLDGPDVALDSQTAESIGLAIHELITNAVKYGALKVPNARLSVTWLTNSDYGDTCRLKLTWTEQGVPAVPLKPARQGFGSELIEEALPYRLGAETKLEFRGGGVRCTISVPLPDETAAAQPWEAA